MTTPDEATLPGIRRIVRERWENPQLHADAHFRINPADLNTIRSGSTTAAPRQPWEPSPLGDLLAIPIVLDDEVPSGRWQLVANAKDADGNHQIRDGGALDAA